MAFGRFLFWNWVKNAYFSDQKVKGKLKIILSEGCHWFPGNGDLSPFMKAVKLLASTEAIDTLKLN
jgi:hypothetical protein